MIDLVSSDLVRIRVIRMHGITKTFLGSSSKINYSRWKRAKEWYISHIFQEC